MIQDLGTPIPDSTCRIVCFSEFYNSFGYMREQYEKRIKIAKKKCNPRQVKLLERDLKVIKRMEVEENVKRELQSNEG